MPEENVHVVLSRTGEIEFALQDPNAIAVSVTDRSALDFSDFVGKEKVDFLIPNIPSGGTYDFQVFSHTSLESPLPQLSIQSKFSVSKQEKASQPWVSSLKSLWKGSFVTDEKGEWLKQLDW